MTSTHSVHKGGECEICGNKLAKDELKTIKISNLNMSARVDNSFIFPSLGKCKKCGKNERDMKQKKEKKLLQEIEKNKSQKEKIHRLLKKRSSESGCIHLHTTCDLRNTGGCCVCRDKRPFAYNYAMYIDGQGDQYTTKRHIGYCPICRIDRERLGQS
jgi:hypothetical protein